MSGNQLSVFTNDAPMTMKARTTNTLMATTMLLTVGLALFSLPSRSTPSITRGCSRSSVSRLSPFEVR